VQKKFSDVGYVIAVLAVVRWPSGSGTGTHLQEERR